MADDRISEATKRILELDKTIKKLDPAIRASAFERLAPLYFDGEPKPPPGDKTKQKGGATAASADINEFFADDENRKPHDNVLWIAAWLYSQHGKFVITKKDIEGIASDVGLTVPDRADATMRAAKHQGKTLFRKSGKGFELTVNGEGRLKELYKVHKGNKPRARDVEEE